MHCCIQVLQSGQFDLSAGEVERLAAQVEAHPSGDIPYSDWIAALIDWRAVQVCILPCLLAQCSSQHERMSAPEVFEQHWGFTAPWLNDLLHAKGLPLYKVGRLPSSKPGSGPPGAEPVLNVLCRSRLSGISGSRTPSTPSTSMAAACCRTTSSTRCCAAKSARCAAVSIAMPTGGSTWRTGTDNSARLAAPSRYLEESHAQPVALPGAGIGYCGSRNSGGRPRPGR